MIRVVKRLWKELAQLLQPIFRLFNNQIDTVMKKLTPYIGGFALLLIAAFGCRDTSGEDYTSSANLQFSKTDSTQNLSDIQHEVEERIQENIDLIETRVEKLEEKVEDQKNQLSAEALRRSTLLKEDLERLKTNLEKTMDSLEDVSDEVLDRNSEYVQSELEQTEDEISQIHQELEEWYDNQNN